MKGGGMIVITTVLAATLAAVTAVAPSAQEAEKAIEAATESMVLDQKVEKAMDDDDDAESPDPDRKVLEEPEKKQKFLFGSYSTTVYTNYVLSTSTVFYSCIAATKTGTVCTGGKRRRRHSKNSNIDMNTEDEAPSIPVVSSTIDNDYEYYDPSAPKPLHEPREKFAFTIWTTSRVTSSLTVFYTNTSTTIRLSYVCSVGMISYPLYNC